MMPRESVTIAARPVWMPPAQWDRLQGLQWPFRFSRPERKVLRKKKLIPVSEWAARHFVLTDGPLKGGFWRAEMAPWSAGMMDASFFPSVRLVINCKGVQSAGSTMINVCLAYAMDRRPGDAMIIMPNQNAARKRVQDRLIPLIENSTVLARLFTGKEDDKASFRIKLLHMLIYAGWAGSPTSLGDTPAMYVVKDEADKWQEADTSKHEASSHKLADKRVTTFAHEFKIWDNSTPTVESGHIWQALLHETQIINSFWVRCPDCATHQVMISRQIQWPGGKEANPVQLEAGRLAYYVCHACGSQWDDYQRDRAALAGEWRALPSAGWEQRLEKLKEGDHAAMAGAVELGEYLRRHRPANIGFHTPAWFSRYVSLSKSAAAILRAATQGLDEVKDLANNYAAEPWRQVVVKHAESDILQARCDLPPQVVPAEAVALVCFIDMQQHGFWFRVRAFARDFTSWGIHHGQLPDWAEVEDLLFNTYYPVQGSDRQMRIWRAGLDTGGGRNREGDVSRTEEAYFWLRKNGTGRGCRVWGTKGSSTPIPGGRLRVGKPLDKTPSGKPLSGGLQLVFLDTDQLKDAFHYRLQQARVHGPQAAYLHRDTGDDYARQIAAERKQKNEKGLEEWHQTGKDNHYLDCEAGCMALADPEWPGGGVNLIRPPEQPIQSPPPAAAPAGRSLPNWYLNRGGR